MLRVRFTAWRVTVQTMNLHDFKASLAAGADKALSFVLPDGSFIPPHFHITEAGHVIRNFVDCGGRRRTLETCLLQAWVAGDTSHRLTAGKLAAIFDHARDLLPDDDLPVEIEYEALHISQFPVTAATVTEDSIKFQLGLKHTDCLAKEKCTPDSCCEPEESCSTGACC